MFEPKIKYRYPHTSSFKGVPHYLVKHECPTDTNKYCLNSPWDRSCIGHLFYIPVENYTQNLTEQNLEDTIKT